MKTLRSLNPLLGLSLALAFTLVASSAGAGDSALRRCRALADAAARLACYDALPLGAPTVAASAAAAANGQLWQVTDDSSAIYNLRDPKVTVRRAAMGTFVLDIEGARRLPRVRRLE